MGRDVAWRTPITILHRLEMLPKSLDAGTPPEFRPEPHQRDVLLPKPHSQTQPREGEARETGKVGTIIIITGIFKVA